MEIFTFDMSKQPITLPELKMSYSFFEVMVWVNWILIITYCYEIRRYLKSFWGRSRWREIRNIIKTNEVKIEANIEEGISGIIVIFFGIHFLIIKPENYVVLPVLGFFILAIQASRVNEAYKNIEKALTLNGHDWGTHLKPSLKERIKNFFTAMEWDRKPSFPNAEFSIKKPVELVLLIATACVFIYVSNASYNLFPDTAIEIHLLLGLFPAALLYSISKIIYLTMSGAVEERKQQYKPNKKQRKKRPDDERKQQRRKQQAEENEFDFDQNAWGSGRFDDERFSTIKKKQSYRSSILAQADERTPEPERKRHRVRVKQADEGKIAGIKAYKPKG